MIFLLDTNIISELMREQPSIVAKLAALASSDRIITCVIVRGEILHGIARLPPSQRREKLLSKAQNLFAAILCEPVPISAAENYATIKAEQQSRGLSLDENDLWVAATTMANSCTLVSHDADFSRIENFPVVDWTTK